MPVASRRVFFFWKKGKIGTSIGHIITAKPAVKPHPALCTVPAALAVFDF